MAKAKILWTSYPFKAGFCITDDTDGATVENVKIVYDLLIKKGIKTTKTVWAFLPDDISGILKSGSTLKRSINLENVTLEDSEYLNYCKKLSEEGFEICLHGASSGNNRRQKTRGL